MEIVISLVLTIFVYLAYPIFYRVANGRVDSKSARKIALINSVCCAIIFLVINIAMNIDAEYISFAPAFFYYFIAKAIITDKNK